MPTGSQRNEAASEVGSAAGPSPDARARWMRRVLSAAVARACPGEPAAEREDLVQIALTRVLEREQTSEQNTVRTASYLWRMAFTVTADEFRQRRSEVKRVQAMEFNLEASHQTPGTELGLAIRECLQRLSEPRRLAVLLYLQGYRAEEASELLRWALKRLQNLTYRGLADLRACLSAKEAGH